MGEQETHDGPLSRESLLAAASHGGVRDLICSSRFGVMLAGGNGERLRSFIQRLRGNVLPKQYVNFIGKRSMLEHTFHRAERLIQTDRLITVVSRDHLKHPEVCRGPKASASIPSGRLRRSTRRSGNFWRTPAFG